MRVARFVITLLLGYVTAFGYAQMYLGMLAMGVSWPQSGFVRLMLIGLTALCFVLSVIGLWMARTSPARERRFTISATIAAYFSFVFAVIAMHARPEIYSFGAWWLLVGFFSAPFVVSAFLLSAEKYNQSEHVAT